jgi:ATP-dependent RNA helicase RhlE
MTETFRQFGLREELQRALDEVGYDAPTPIQSKAIPLIMSGHDLVGVAQTGTGKTLAYLLPILQAYKSGEDGTHAVVVCPTRELAIQVAGESERFGKYLGVRTVLAYGGTSSSGQKSELTQGCDLLVATPGRLLDFLGQGWVSTRRTKFLVLDEADRMLDMGFINDVDAIVRRVPMSRQTLLFSATFPPEIKILSERYLMHPETVRIDTAVRVKESVEHTFLEVPSRQKVDLLVALLDRERPSKCLVFTATREMTTELSRRLRTRNHEVVSLSSLLSQSNRERALTAFRNGVFDVLVATDVAARGLDIDDIDLVVNFDVPMHAEDYVHRIGRTGRAHREGKALTLVSEMDGPRVAQIEAMLGHAVRRETVEGFAYGPLPQGSGRRAGGSRGPGGRRAGGERGGAGGQGASSERRQSGGRRGGRRRAGGGTPPASGT